MPDAVSKQPLFAEFRALPGGDLAVVRLGEVPRLIEQLETEITKAWWDAEREQAVIELSILNAGEGPVHLGPEFIQIAEWTAASSEGGDAYEGTWQVTPACLFVINPGETAGDNSVVSSSICIHAITNWR